MLLLLYSCGTTGDYPMSDHYNGKVFKNPNGLGPHGFFEVLKWKMSFSGEKWPSKFELKYPEYTPPLKVEKDLSITFINHVTFLIQTEGLNILTDPVYSDRTSPVGFAGPVAIHKPGIDFDKLPPIDLVVISHNHYDHMDRETIKRLEQKFSPQFIVPLNNGELIKTFGAKKIKELDWWESSIFLDKLKVTLTPAQHWSSRTPFDRNKSLWGGFFLETPRDKIFFAGDTGYSDHFKEIAKKLGAPSLALLPIGAYAPRWFMKTMHMNPEDAVLAHLDLESKNSIGMHFGTFQLTDEAYDTPEKDLSMALEKLKVKNFKTLKPGENVVY